MLTPCNISLKLCHISMYLLTYFTRTLAAYILQAMEQAISTTTTWMSLIKHIYRMNFSAQVSSNHRVCPLPTEALLPASCYLYQPGAVAVPYFVHISLDGTRLLMLINFFIFSLFLCFSFKVSVLFQTKLAIRKFVTAR